MRMTFAEFCQRVAHLTVAEIRGDVPQPQSVIDLIDEIGLNRYEQLALRYTRDPAAAGGFVEVDS